MLFVLLTLFSGFAGIQLAINSVNPKNVTIRDFLPEYLVARAVLERVDPYQPLSDLNRRLVPDDKVPCHRSPHTPVLAISFVPLAFLSFVQAAKVWLLVQFLFLCASIFLLFRGLKITSTPLLVLFATWAALGWCHVWEDMIYGQINTVLLFLIVGAWLSLREGRQGLGGAMLGGAISLKLIFWPIALFLLLRRQSFSVLMVVAVFVATNLIAAVAMGWKVVVNYYVVVGPSVGALYRNTSQNLSLWSIGWRTFVGTATPGMTEVEAPPLFFSPDLAVITSLLLISAAFVLGLAAALQIDKYGKADVKGNFDFAYGIMVCVSLLVSPVTWPHYLMMTALPVALIICRLKSLEFPLQEIRLTIIAVVILLIPDSLLQSLVLLFTPSSSSFYNDPGIQSDWSVSFAAGLLRLIPVVSVIIQCWLMYQLPRKVGTCH